MKLGLQHGSVKLSPYEEAWLASFAQAKEELQGCLGDLAVGIEHVGSTAVTGLEAKAILDIAVGVRDLEPVDEYITRFAAIDYGYRPEYSSKERHVFVRGEELVTHHVHVVLWQGSQWNQFLFFRDHLRSHPQDANEYRLLKRDLASRFAADRSSYTAGKAAFICRILAKGAPIRQVTPEDAAALLALLHTLDRESQYMLLEPGERHITVAKQQEKLQGLADKSNCFTLTAEVNGDMIGYVQLLGDHYQRNRHCGYIVIGILAAFTSLGIGHRMLAAVEDYAIEHGITRLELTVMVTNAPGVGLYKKRGFQIEGIRRNSLIVDHSYVDEYYMAKLLPEPKVER